MSNISMNVFSKILKNKKKNISLKEIQDVHKQFSQQRQLNPEKSLIGFKHRELFNPKNEILFEGFGE